MRGLAAMAWTIGLFACGGDPSSPGSSSAPPPGSPAAPPSCTAGVPRAACRAGVRVCAAGDRDRIGEWRFALVTGLYDPVDVVSLGELREAWRTGAIAASAETAPIVDRLLEVHGTAPRLVEHAQLDTGHRGIVAAHELVPAWQVVAIDGHHPLAGDGGALALPLCGTGAPVRNIDPDRLTTLVMSGTTAMTGRIAERIDTNGVADTIRYIQPWFASADLVHVSNENVFVRRCDPKAGQRELKFCSRPSYIAVLEALHARIIELTGSHLYDHGFEELVKTIAMYEQRGWSWFGGGRTQIEASEPRVVEHRGNRLAFLGCNAVGTWIHAVHHGPGVASCDWARMEWQVRDLRRRGFTPIVSIQHQEVLVHDPPAGLVHDLRRFAEAGAAFVLGSQAHCAHPWDVHRGTFVHYGPGNTLFAQAQEQTREAALDKLYIHAGRLLAVERLYTRIEHGRPRLLTAAERARFVGELARAEARLVPAEPWATAPLPDEPRVRPDSLVMNGRNQFLAVAPPAHVTAGTRYPLVVVRRSASPFGDAARFGAAEPFDRAGTAPPRDDAFVVARTGKPVASDSEIVAFMLAKYPIDPSHVAIVPAPARTAPQSRHRLARLASPN